jgi:uncharacterized protein with NRDE domain
MCLVGIAFKSHPDYPLILVGNRDEYHARPTAVADWWDDDNLLFGGRDLEAGGTWLAASREGRIGVVTNRPDLPAPAQRSLSRGALVHHGVLADDHATINLLPEDHHRYGGFSLLLATRDQLEMYTGGNGTDFIRHRPDSGIVTLSNTAIDQPWPKAQWLNRELQQIIASGTPDIDDLSALLSHRNPVPDSSSQGVPATPFVVGETYGTRCSTVILLDKQGHCVFREHRYGPGGSLLGQTEVSFPTLN